MLITVSQEVKDYMKKNNSDSLIIDMHINYTNPG